jgi:hypothetical protein
LSLHKYACGIWFPLNRADGSPSEQLSPEYSATSAREKSQLIHHHGAGSKGMGSGLIFFGFTHLLPTNAAKGHLPAFTAFLIV